MAQRDVRHFVRHHSGDFTLALRGFHHAAIEEHRAARQREGVDVFLVHDVKRVLELRVLELGRHCLSKSPADPFDVVVNAPVVEHRQLFLGLCRGLSSELHVFSDGVFVLRRDDPGLRDGERREREAQREHRRDSCASSGEQESSHTVKVKQGPAKCKARQRRMTTPTVKRQKPTRGPTSPKSLGSRSKVRKWRSSKRTPVRRVRKPMAPPPRLNPIELSSTCGGRR
jgi:hypothetical protein